MKLKRAIKAQIKAQKEGKRKKKVKQKKTQTQATSKISIIQEADPLRESLEDLENDVNQVFDIANENQAF